MTPSRAGRARAKRPPAEAAPKPASFAVYALSRGKGVPPEADDALRRVREMVGGDKGSGVRVQMTTTRVGLEGETRLCLEYQDAGEAARALPRIRSLVEGVDLVNLVVEACVGTPGEEPYQ